MIHSKDTLVRSGEYEQVIPERVEIPCELFQAYMELLNQGSRLRVQIGDEGRHLTRLDEGQIEMEAKLEDLRGRLLATMGRMKNLVEELDKTEDNIRSIAANMRDVTKLPDVPGYVLDLNEGAYVYKPALEVQVGE